MFRKSMLALAATVALGTTALAPSTASAHYYGPGFGFRHFGIRVVVPVATPCWQYRYFETRRGWRRVLVNVCGY